MLLLGFDHLIAIDYENLYKIIKTVYDIFIKMPVSVNHKKRTTYSLFFSYPFFKIIHACMISIQFYPTHSAIFQWTAESINLKQDDIILNRVLKCV